MIRYRVDITRREGLADPEGAATLRALRDLGHGAVTGVHFGRVIYVDVDEKGPEAIAEMCEQLLANPVIEDYTITEVVRSETDAANGAAPAR